MGAIKLVVFDVAGTTAKDDGLVVAAFETAMLQLGIPAKSSELMAMIDYVNLTMGQRKIDVFTHLCGGDEIRAEIAHLKFIEAYNQLISDGQMSEFDGVTKMFKDLQARGIEVAITTGFPREILDRILTATKWGGFLTITVAADEVPHGRPAPDMIYRCIDSFNFAKGKNLTPSEVAVVGDTTSDIESGLAAKALIVAGVKTGAHSAAQLKSAGATHILEAAVEISTFC